MDEMLNSGKVEYRGSERIRILFQPLGVAHDLYRNIKRIYDVDANEGDKYLTWLKIEKIPALKDALEDALVKEFINSGNEGDFWKYVTKLQCNFKKFENLIDKEYNELEFLRSYV